MKEIKVEPDFTEMSDADLTGLVAWCEKWNMEDVYNTAYKQVNMKGPEFIEWVMSDYRKLPIPVRIELQRAAKISYESGRMFSLQVAHWFLATFWMVVRHSSYAFFAFTLAYWILK